MQSETRIGRNQPCPCGSGKKYKQCCLRDPAPGNSGPPAEAHRVAADCIAGAAAQLKANRFDAAESLLERALVLDPDHGRALCLLGVALHGQGRLAESAERLARAVALAPDSFEAQNNFARVLLDLGQTDAAVRCVERALGIEPDNPVALNNLGNAVLRRGETTAAIGHFRRAIAQAPDYAPAHYNLGRALSDWGDLAAALACFEEARRIEPAAAITHNNIGTVLQGLGRVDEAIAACRRALELDPACAEAHANLHALVLSDSDPTLSIDHLRQAIALRPDDASLQFFLGALLERAGDPKGARQYLDPLAIGNPLDRARLDALSYLRSLPGTSVRLIGSPVDAFRIGLASAPTEGLVLEFGVRFGTSLRLIATLAGQPVHGFDSFQGLPEDWHDEPRGSYSTDGRLPAMPENVTLHAGWFDDSLPRFLAAHPGPLRFANIDCDLYSSTRTVLALLAERIVSGSVLVFDEYLAHTHWREDEFRAFQEAVTQYGWRYEYLCCGLSTKQAVVRIL